MDWQVVPRRRRVVSSVSVVQNKAIYLGKWENYKCFHCTRERLGLRVRSGTQFLGRVANAKLSLALVMRCNL